MNSTIKCIIFDFGNVLVKWDAHKIYDRFFASPEAVDSFLEEINFLDWNAHQDAGRPFKDGVVDLSRQFPQYAELIQAYDTYWEDSVAEVVQGTIDILYKLKRSKWPLYVLSNFSLEKFQIMQKKYHFLELFDDIIISGEHGVVKPAPAIFKVTLSRIRRSAPECLFIDDSLLNIEAAKSLGFATIHFQSPDQLEVEMRKFHI